MQLREYQEKLIADIRVQFQLGHRRVLAVSPTGSGKTATTAAMIKRTVERNKTAIFTVHRQELMDQSIDAFNQQGIDFGLIAAGIDMDLSKPVQIASIETLRRRLNKINIMPSLFVVDEAAHSCSTTWSEVINHFTTSRFVGLTACPQRKDGRGLGDIYSAMIEGPTVSWLIKNKYLSEFDIYAPPSPDFSKVSIRGGDFAVENIPQHMDVAKITGDAVHEYMKHCSGQRALTFCFSIENSKYVAQLFNNAGIPSAHIDGDTPKEIRRSMIGAFKRGELINLCSVDLFGEGTDIPAVECIIMLRPTQSLSVLIQQIGRVMRVFPGKTIATILDHVGNMRRHDFFPDDIIEWSLQSKRRSRKDSGESDIKIRQCKKCYHYHRPAPCCPKCGYIYPKISREVKQIDGELTKYEKESLKKKQDWSLIYARSRGELEALARERGYKNPTVWAEIKLAIREKRKPDFKIAMKRRANG